MNKPTVPKPAPCPVQPDNIPAALKARAQWVNWRWTWKKGTANRAGKWDKPPVNARTGRPASSTDRGTWSTFDVAYAAYRDPKNGFDGIGYVFSGESDDFVGVDLDDCIDPATGELEEWSAEQRQNEHWAFSPPDPKDIIDALNSYGEVSPSGTGVKLIVRGTIPKGIKHGDFEAYRSGRYFTVTGHRLADCLATISECGDELLRVYSAFDARAKDRTRTPKVGAVSRPQTDQSHGGGMCPTIEQVLAACNNASNGDKFRRLFDGDTSDYASPSEADAALCGILAFWCSGHAELIDSVFRRSKLLRDKWDETHASDGKTYGQMTVEAAIALVPNCFDWTTVTPREYAIDGLTLHVRTTRQTAAKLNVQLEVRKNGKPIDIIKLTDSAAGRKAAVKAIAEWISESNDANRKVNELLGLILAETVQSIANSARRSGRGVYHILADHLPQQLELQYATSAGKAFSAQLGFAISRSQFIERFTSDGIVNLTSTGNDAPRDENGLVLRPQLISLVERELKVLWGQMISQLPKIEDAELTRDSHAAVAFRQSIVGLWTRLATMGIHKKPISKDESVQLATRSSLASTVRRLEVEGLSSACWHAVQTGFDAYLRFARGDFGEQKTILAMRFELAKQLGIEIPDATDQKTLKTLGVKFGAFDDAPTAFGRPVPHRMTGGERMAVLTEELTKQILACPDESSPATKSVTPVTVRGAPVTITNNPASPKTEEKCDQKTVQ